MSLHGFCVGSGRNREKLHVFVSTFSRLLVCSFLSQCVLEETGSVVVQTDDSIILKEPHTVGETADYDVLRGTHRFLVQDQKDIIVWREKRPVQKACRGFGKEHCCLSC